MRLLNPNERTYPMLIGSSRVVPRGELGAPQQRRACFDCAAETLLVFLDGLDKMS